MKTIPILIAAFAVQMIILCTNVPASSEGRLCLAPVPQPTSGQKSLANPTGGNQDIDYSVRVDQGDWIELSPKEAIWVSDLDMEEKHLITIRGDGKQIESFYFRFEKAHPDLCLFLKPLYLTWILWPVEETGDWCPCYNDNQ